ncbi:MAG: type III secretion system chaperone [Deltaproteobacteria bacterium]|jgi:hypothetical protein|nr:type III secretion system chaperone [Deltaproteobacteria bacterium]
MKKLASKANELLQALAAYLNQPLIELDGNYSAAVTIGRYNFVFSFSECGMYLLSRVPITVLPGCGRRGDLLRQLVASNYSSAGTLGGIVGLEKETGLIWLTYRFWLKQGNAEDFLKTIALQTGLAEYWLKTVTTNPALTD